MERRYLVVRSDAVSASALGLRRRHLHGYHVVSCPLFGLSFTTRSLTTICFSFNPAPGDGCQSYSGEGKWKPLGGIAEAAANRSPMKAPSNNPRLSDSTSKSQDKTSNPVDGREARVPVIVSGQQDASASPLPEMPPTGLRESEHKMPQEGLLDLRDKPLSKKNFEIYGQQDERDLCHTSGDSLEVRTSYEQAATCKSRRKNQTSDKPDLVDDRASPDASKQSIFTQQDPHTCLSSKILAGSLMGQRLPDQKNDGNLCNSSEGQMNVVPEQHITNAHDLSDGSIEVEIITRDGIIRRKAAKRDEYFYRTTPCKRDGLLDSNDFRGLDFFEKKCPAVRRLPAGFSAGLEPPPLGTKLPEVEIITRDGTMDDNKKTGLYKPKVSTWGVFERPANISQAYGGGRIIRPGEQLETKEEKEAREIRTQQLLDTYRKKAGLDVKPSIRFESVKAYEQGNGMMEKGRMKNALVYFEKVMKQMPYQSELHGLAALQWSVCVDSLNRFEEARVMYQKISSHPNVIVRKKAKQLLFGFRAMETLKLSKSAYTDLESSSYRKYFDAVANDGYSNTYMSDGDENSAGKLLSQSFIYMAFLVSPLAVLFFMFFLRSR